MVELVRSRHALTLAALAAALWALALVLVGVGYATYSPPSGLGVFANLITAASWLLFAAAFGALSACCYCTWFFFVRQRFDVALEVASLAFATLFFAIGALMQAASSAHYSDAGSVFSAVGLGGWAAVLVVRAARQSIREQQDPTLPRKAGIFMTGAGAVAVLAVGVGLPTPSLADAALAVTKDVIFGLGWMGLAVVLYAGRRRWLITSAQVVTVQTGLWVLFASAVVLAVTDGLIFGPPLLSLTGFRLDSIGRFVAAVGAGMLAVAAVRRIGELPVPAATAPAVPDGAEQSPWFPPHPSETAPTTAPPAWQPDPYGRHEARWWDGVRWTEHVLDAGIPGIDPPT